MQQNNNVIALGAALLVGLLVGGIGGYFYGGSSATKSINEQIAAQEKENAESRVNPYEDVETNPLKDVKTNPYDVKLNPFD